MELRTKVLVALYCFTALLALVMAWIHLPAYFGNGIVGANVQFWKDALFNANPAGRFLTVDILFLGFVCNVWMFIEGRRVGVKYLYVYVIAGIFIAISVAFPLFMAARELRVAALDSSKTGYSIKVVDVLALIFLFAITLLASIATF
ncbi:MAG: hypothetical protein ACI9SK_002145 [Zhongshania sp.]